MFPNLRLLFLRFFIVVQEINYPSCFIVYYEIKQRKKRRISLFHRSRSKPSSSRANSTSLRSRVFVLCRYFRQQREKSRWHDRRKFIPSEWGWMVYGYCHKSLKTHFNRPETLTLSCELLLWLVIQAANYRGNYWQSYIKGSLSLEVPSFVLVEFWLEFIVNLPRRKTRFRFPWFEALQFVGRKTVLSTVLALFTFQANQLIFGPGQAQVRREYRAFYEHLCK